MNKLISWSFLFLFVFSCKDKASQPSINEQEVVSVLIDHWHDAASKADFKSYFDCMDSKAVFIGTDPTENWSYDSFKVFCKPYFDKGKAWNFKSMQRHMFFNNDHSMAWFDELLNTQMKICRGSGVLKKENDQWKIVQYVLSMTIPNEHTKEVVALKKLVEDKIIDSLQTR